MILRTSLLLSGFALLALAAGGYHVSARYNIPGDGGYDYLTIDAAARRLYVSHGSLVEVLNADTGSVVGQIKNTKGVHGIAIARELGRGFTSNGQSDTSTVFDLKTLAILGEVKTGKKPDFILYEPVTKRVFTFNGDSADATVIDAAKAEVIGRVDLGGGPEAAIDDGKGNIYVNLEEKGEVVQFDARTLAVKNTWPLAPCGTPTGMDIDRKNGRLFVGCRSKVMAVLDTHNGKVIATLPIGTGVDAVAFDESSGNIFNSNGDGTLTVIHQDTPDKYTVVENAATERYAKTMTLDSKTHHIFLSVAKRAEAPAGQKKAGGIVPGSFAILVVSN